MRDDLSVNTSDLNISYHKYTFHDEQAPKFMSFTFDHPVSYDMIRIAHHSTSPQTSEALKMLEKNCFPP